MLDGVAVLDLGVEPRALPDWDLLPWVFEQDVEGSGVVEVEEGEVRAPFGFPLSEPELDLEWEQKSKRTIWRGFRLSLICARAFLSRSW